MTLWKSGLGGTLSILLLFTLLVTATKADLIGVFFHGGDVRSDYRTFETLGGPDDPVRFQDFVYNLRTIEALAFRYPHIEFGYNWMADIAENDWLSLWARTNFTCPKEEVELLEYPAPPHDFIFSVPVPPPKYLHPKWIPTLLARYEQQRNITAHDVPYRTVQDAWRGEAKTALGSTHKPTFNVLRGWLWRHHRPLVAWMHPELLRFYKEGTIRRTDCIPSVHWTPVLITGVSANTVSLFFPWEPFFAFADWDACGLGTCIAWTQYQPARHAHSYQRG